MKKILLIFTFSIFFIGCATTTNNTSSSGQVASSQYAALSAKTSAWLGEEVIVESVDKGFLQTDFIVVNKKGKKSLCYYTGFFGSQMSSIVCGNKGNPFSSSSKKY